MTRFPHDRFAKQFLSDLLDPLGAVEVNRMVSDEVREVDLYFTPALSGEPQSLGLLGRLASSPCLLEPFRNPVHPDEIRNCVLKRSIICAQLQRQARRDQQAPPLLPSLWILTPTASRAILRQCGAKATPETWGKGIYRLPPLLGTGLVVIHQLPEVPDTLWLRLLGRGRVQQRAIQELLALPEEMEMRQNTIRVLSNCQIVVDEQQEELAAEERELMMNLSPVFLEWEKRTQQIGEQRGIEIGEQRGIEIGEQRGIEIGEQRGIEIGEQRGREEVARRMLAAGMIPAQIAQLTGLSLEQLRVLSTEET